MTKREMFETIATVNADNAEIVEFCKHEIELLSRKSGSKSLTKTQKANIEVMEAIKEALANFADGVTVTDLIASTPALAGFTNQKVSALLRKMKDEGIVNKAIEGKKAIFTLA